MVVAEKYKCPYCGKEFEDRVDYCIHVEECEIKFYLKKLRGERDDNDKCLNCSYWEEEDEDDEEDYSCLGEYTPGAEECEFCPLRDLCEEVTDPHSWMIDEEEESDGYDRAR